MLLSNAAQIRQADEIQIQERHVPGILLMERAGSLATGHILESFPNQDAFLILAGPGNNGGDGLVIARYLHLAGKEVQVLLSHTGERFTGDAKVNHQILAELPVPLLLYEEEILEEVIGSFPRPPVLIDALLGTGVQASLRLPISSLIAEIRPFGLKTVAIDLPVG